MLILYSKRGRSKENIQMATPLGGRFLLWWERESSQRHLEEFRAERRGSRLDMARAISSEHREAEESQRRARKRIIENLAGWGSVMIPFHKFLDNAGFYLTCQKSFYCLAWAKPTLSCLDINTFWDLTQTNDKSNIKTQDISNRY